MDWNPILNWKLLQGSHKFPGPEGGTCINEAAIVASGFKYRSVSKPKDCPPCFSRVIAQYAISLNDKMPDKLRQELLMPFVVRLAGTADTKKIERARAEFIVLHTVKRILPVLLRLRGINADDCENASNLKEAKKAAHDAAAAAAAAYDAYADAYADDAAAAAYAYAAAYVDDAAATASAAAAATASAAAYASAASSAAAYAASAASSAAAATAGATAAAAYAAAAAARKQIWTMATQILSEAIDMGKHGEPPEIEVVKERMTLIRKIEAVS